MFKTKHYNLKNKKKISFRRNRKINSFLSELNINTICTNALCPNISECFSKKHLTFLILGDICTRNCRFCGVKHGRPHLIDRDEPLRIKTAVKKLGLNHVVITSPTRDDLKDGGASVFAGTTTIIKQYNPDICVELLIPDFNGNEKSLQTVINSNPDIIGHNIETVPRLYKIRTGADYIRSLSILKTIKYIDPSVKTKSCLMLGLGETDNEIIKTMKDIKKTGCNFFCLGQYLAPRKSNYPVKEYINPDNFEKYKQIAYSIGFEHVESGFYVRSSYKAQEYLNETKI
ncbi:MAG: lipoyl synthase [Elusimicrobiota bacterium]